MFEAPVPNAGAGAHRGVSDMSTPTEAQAHTELWLRPHCCFFRAMSHKWTVIQAFKKKRGEWKTKLIDWVKVKTLFREDVFFFHISLSRNRPNGTFLQIYLFLQNVKQVERNADFKWLIFFFL